MRRDLAMHPMNHHDMNPDRKRASRDPWALARRACLGGLGTVALLSMIAWAAGMIPVALSGFVFTAVCVAGITCSLGVVFKAFALTGDGPGLKPGQMLQLAIFGDFVLQLFVLGSIMLSMYLSGVKFSASISFALAYAGVVFVFPLVATVILGRDVRRRARHRQALEIGADVAKQVRGITTS